jgi:hypothetical protein
VTDGLDQALANAGLALLRADVGPPALVVFDGKVPGGSTPPYVLVYTSVERPAEDEDNAADGRSRVWVVRWICHCVGSGEDAAAARGVAQRVRAALLDARPSIANLSCGPIRQEPGSPPPQRDESTGVLVMDAIVTYRLKATS